MKTWKDCVAFHGHECGGLTIGYKASLYAIALLNLEFSADEQVVCIAENDACGVDTVTSETLNAVYGINAEVLDVKGRKIVIID